MGKYRILLTILAWVDWSSYCKGYSYRAPKGFCRTFWGALFSFILLPVTYLGNIWNLIVVPFADFRDEYNSDNKLNMSSSVLIHVGLIVLGVLGHVVSDGIFKWDLFHVVDGILLNYGKLLLSGLAMCVVCAAIIGLIILIGTGISRVFKRINSYYQYKQSNGIYESADAQPQVPKEPHVVVKVYKTLKGKYCPPMDWSGIINRRESDPVNVAEPEFPAPYRPIDFEINNIENN